MTALGTLDLVGWKNQVQVLETQSLWTLNRRVTSNTWKTTTHVFLNEVSEGEVCPGQKKSPFHELLFVF